MLGMSKGATILILSLLAVVGVVILLIRLKVLPVDSERLEKILKMLDRMPKLTS